MKRIFKLVLVVLVTLNFTLSTVQAQTPQKMTYQAVVRNASNNLVTNTAVGIEINILQGSATGTQVYTETQTPTTNNNGLLTIEIGGEVGFDTITWVNAPYFLETNIDPDNSGTYTITGVNQLLTVPYALHAKTAESITGGITETDPVYSSSQAANITATDITNLSNLSGTNTGNQDISGIATNLQAIQDTASQIRADFTDVSSFITTETDPVFIVWDKSTGISITESQITDLQSYLTTEVDGSVTNEIQDLSFSGTTLSLTGDGSTVDLSSLQDGFEANTDDQKIDAFSLFGTTLSLSLENDGQSARTVNLSSLKDGTGTDDQKIDQFSISNNRLYISLEGDGQSAKYVNLSSYLDNQTLSEILSTNTNAGAHKISNLSDPTLAQDAATKAYVDLLEDKLNALELRISALEPQTLEIGDFHEGGVVFWLSPDKTSGYVCSVGSYLAKWGCYGTSITGADGLYIGQGAQNTLDIEAGCTTAGTAADICANLTLNGYNDWFLPSRGELIAIYNNKAIISTTSINNGGSSLGTSRYWSSSENTASLAYNVWFNDGTYDNYLKGVTYSVRAIRRF